jgi:hypothetical protein
MLAAATRLERALAWRELGLKLRRMAAVVALVGFGWFAHGQVGLGISDSEASPKPPAFVEDALHAHETLWCGPAWFRNLRPPRTTRPRS